MTLHEAIEKLLCQTGQSMTTDEIAKGLNINKWYQKKDGSKISDYQIHRRTNNYSQLFIRHGSSVSLLGHNTMDSTSVSDSKIKRKKSDIRDEHYVLDLCDKILLESSSRQHRFDFLLGDKNKNGVAVKLPVDAYYEKLNLVIEYREKQHTENIAFFDKINVMTISGVSRDVQRKIYDERRRNLIPLYGIKLIELSYSDFNFNNRKQIVRNEQEDTEILKQLLHSIIHK